MIIKEENLIYDIETIDGVEVKKRVKIQTVSLTGGGQYQPIDWYKSTVRMSHSKQLEVIGCPAESASISIGDITFEDLVAMAGGDMAQFAIAWADKVDEAMNPVEEVITEDEVVTEEE